MDAGDIQSMNEANSVLLQLNIAHILVPIFNAMSLLCNKNESYVMEKIFDTISIFQYQATIFYAQLYQMNSPTERKLVGINGWFMIEILSFYGYILSAMWFIVEE